MTGQARQPPAPGPDERLFLDLPDLTGGLGDQFAGALSGPKREAPTLVGAGRPRRGPPHHHHWRAPDRVVYDGLTIEDRERIELAMRVKAKHEDHILGGQA